MVCAQVPLGERAVAGAQPVVAASCLPVPSVLPVSPAGGGGCWLFGDGCGCVLVVAGVVVVVGCSIFGAGVAWVCVGAVRTAFFFGVATCLTCTGFARVCAVA
jgi:hypothetical protein